MEVVKITFTLMFFLSIQVLDELHHQFSITLCQIGARSAPLQFFSRNNFNGSIFIIHYYHTVISMLQYFNNNMRWSTVYSLYRLRTPKHYLILPYLYFVVSSISAYNVTREKERERERENEIRTKRVEI